MRIGTIILSSLTVALMSSACSTIQTSSATPQLFQSDSAPVHGSSTGSQLQEGKEFGRQPNPSRSKGWLRPSSSGQELYVSFAANYINVYDAVTLAQIGQITAGLNDTIGLAIDSSGMLYVANLTNRATTGFVTIYKHGKTSVFRKIRTCADPGDVALGANSQLYVACTNGSIQVYTNYVLSATLTYSGMGFASGVSVDGSGNVYVAGAATEGSKSYFMIEFPGGNQPGKNLNLLGLQIPAKILIDTKGNLVVPDLYVPGILLYHPNKHASYKTIAGPHPTLSAFNSTKALLYSPQAFGNVLNVYNYPAGTIANSLSLGTFVAGAAVWPPAPN